MTRKQTTEPVKKKNQGRAGDRRRRLQFEGLEERDLLASNAIALENQLPGNPPSQWDIVGVGDTSIQGFATDISVGQGAPISFKINNVSRAPYRLDIYRIGYYAGNGARQVATIPSSQTIRTVQPAPLTNPALGLIDAGNWSVSATWNVPANATSGVYIAKAVREDTGGASHIIFVVRNDDSRSDLLFQTSDTTWQAYNRWGGNSFYAGPYDSRAYAVSYNRPFDTRAGTPKDWFFSSEYAMVRWLEQNGYDVSYTTGLDSDRRGSEILEHRVFLSVGHDEYWSGAQRANVEAARDAGVNLAFFSGNEVYWKTRWQTSLDASGTPNRTLVSYKETFADAKIDPFPNVWTGTWRDNRFSPPADGGRPENALTGQLFTVNRGPGGDLGTSFTVDSSYSQLRFWRNTRVANLLSGQSVALGDYVLGYEWDEDVDNGFRPRGLINMSSTTQSVPEKIDQYGHRQTSPGTATHSLTLYRATSGALVFGAGTVQWAWGLSGTHDVIASTPDPAIQQATVNLLADMGAQPFTLQAGLVLATMSTDVVAPDSSIVSIASNAVFQTGVPVTIRGTASDIGGVVAGVEVSADGGNSWKRAAGGANWTYTWVPTAVGPTTLSSRAVDDSGNVQPPSSGMLVAVELGKSSFWSGVSTPAVQSTNDASAVELGMRFQSTQDGYITGIRFYKGGSNTGTHVGKLWTTNGALLGSTTFASESASGWQYATFDKPILISANTSYVASYFAPNGGYSANQNYFLNNLNSGPLVAFASNANSGNGLYHYGAGGGFPVNSFLATNYWVDVEFVDLNDHTSPTITSHAPITGAVDVAVATDLQAVFNEAIQEATISFVLKDSLDNVVPSVLTYDSNTRVATLNPNGSLAGATTYTATISGARDLAGNSMQPISWSFTTLNSIDSTPPVLLARSPSASAVEVALKVNITGRFSESIQTSNLVFSLTDSGNQNVPGTVSYDELTHTVTLNPTDDLLPQTRYTVTLNARDLAGNVTDTSWSFTTQSVVMNASLWNTTVVPAVQSAADTSAVELGLKFRADRDGFITGMKFYKGPQNTGVHVGHLWGPSGTLLGSATFVNETSSGWQWVNFGSAIAIVADTTYIVSYYAPNGGYAHNTGYFTTASFINGPLTALADAAQGGNGVYRYGVGGGLPLLSYNATNYWVDIVFSTSLSDLIPPSLLAQSPAPDTTNVSVSTTVQATFSESMQINSIAFELRNASGTLVAANTTYNYATHSVTLLPNALLTAVTTYTVTLSGARDLAGNLLPASSWIFTTGATVKGASLWNDQTTPSLLSANDTSSLELGVKFQSDRTGYITGIKFYKGAANTGQHIGNLWSSTGTLLASANFTSESASGWQTILFVSPVFIAADTIYVASYFAPVGGYSFDADYFSVAWTSGPLRVPASAASGGNGLYRYGARSVFPDQSFKSANYWVDVVFSETL